MRYRGASHAICDMHQETALSQLQLFSECTLPALHRGGECPFQGQGSPSGLASQESLHKKQLFLSTCGSNTKYYNIHSKTEIHLQTTNLHKVRASVVTQLPPMWLQAEDDAS